MDEWARRRRMSLWWGAIALACLGGVTAYWLLDPDALERAAFGRGALVVAGIAIVATAAVVATVLAGPRVSGPVRWILGLGLALVNGLVGAVAVIALVGGGQEAADLGPTLALATAVVGIGVVTTQVAPGRTAARRHRPGGKA